MQKKFDKYLPKTKEFAKKYGVDLAIPHCRGSGLGNALVYTRLVEDWARFYGRPATIATAPLDPLVGVVNNEDPFAIWRNNPFVEKILNGYELAKEEFELVDLERKTLMQLNHIIENIGFAYGLRPREIRPSIFLSEDEMKWAQKELQSLPRPLVCLHPGGTSRSLNGATWANHAWHEIIEKFQGKVGFFQVGRIEFGDIDLGLTNPGKTIRQMMSLIWASDIFIGFDSSPMHVATAFKIPTVAVFDMERKFRHELIRHETFVPSVMLRWSYPSNRNIAIMSENQSKTAIDIVIDEITRITEKLTYRF